MGLDDHVSRSTLLSGVIRRPSMANPSREEGGSRVVRFDGGSLPPFMRHGRVLAQITCVAAWRSRHGNDVSDWSEQQ
jgi:hypothetical protein